MSLELKLKGYRIPEVFVVGRISEDVILGMPFLSDRRCTILKVMVRSTGVLTGMGDLVNDVQVVRQTILAPAKKQVVLVRVTSRSYCPVGIVESVGEHLLVAASLNIPKKRGRI